MRDRLQTITPPTHCPICSSTLVWIKDQLFCENPSCEGKSSKRIEHFAKTLKIKGLGPATINKLKITTLYDIYSFNIDMMIDALGSEKLAVKLHREIQASKTVDLVDLLPAFSIKLIGRTASNKICQVISHIDELSDETCKEAGLGPVATENLLDWYYEEFIGGYDNLPFKWSTNIEQQEVSRGIVCITGKLKSYKTKAAATEVLNKMGYLVKSSLTKDVNILVNERLVNLTTDNYRKWEVNFENNKFTAYLN